MRIFGSIALLVITQCLVGCGGSDSTLPSAPSTHPQPAPQPVPGGINVGGTVYDTAFRSLSDVTVEILDGPQAGTKLVVSGSFSLRGTFDDTTRFRATKDGYVPSTVTMQPICASCNPPRWIHFYLGRMLPPVEVAGDYTLTFTTDASCTDIPPEARSRTYAATVSGRSNSGAPANAYFDVKLGGATFWDNWNWLSIGVSGDYVAFWLEPVVEQLGANIYLAFNGTASASVQTTAVSSIETRFDGTIDYCVVAPETGQYNDCYQHGAVSRAVCANNRLILTRR